jgi:hypothetical protein
MSTATQTKRRRQRGNKTNIQRHKFVMCTRKCKGNKNYRQCMSACLKGR